MALARLLMPLFLVVFYPLLPVALAADGTATVVPKLAATVTNVTPNSGEWFGSSLASLRDDLIVVGAPQAGFMVQGEAYLFDT